MNVVLIDFGRVGFGAPHRKPEVVLRRSFLQFVVLVWNKLATALDCSFILLIYVFNVHRISNLQRQSS